MKTLLRHAVLLVVTIVLQIRVFGQQGGTLNVPGLMKFEVFTNIAGTTVDLLFDDLRYPNTPSQTGYLAGFDTRTAYPTDSLENYGGRITGFVVPPESGDYEFFLRSDDSSQLYLSLDENLANAELIAEEADCCDAFEESGALETSAPWSLIAGRRYAIMAVYKEGTGGDYCQVAWRRIGDTTPAAQLRPIPAAYVSSALPAGGTISFTRQPASASAAQNDFVTFEVEISSTLSPVLVQWQKNGVTLPGVTGASLTLGPLPASDHGARIRALVSIPGAVASSDEAVLTVTADVTPPQIHQVVGSESFETVTVDFTEAITAASAGNSANYQLSGGLTVQSATVVTPSRVQLSTSRQTAGATYTLTVNNLADTGGNTIVSNTSREFPAFAFVRGGLKFQAYLNIAGTPVQGLLDDPRYPDSPDIEGYVVEFSTRRFFTDDSHENYGGRLSGWIVPAETAEYHFFIRSDDASQLYLSSDDTIENLVLIAQETGCCGAFEDPALDPPPTETSAPVSLVAGRRYRIEAIWKEGGGGDYCDVAWRKVGDPAVPRSLPYIAGSVLETLAAPGTFTPPSIAITAPEDGSNVAPGVPVTVVTEPLASAGKSVSRVEFYEATTKLGEVTSAPWSLTLTDLSEDVHVITARVIDSAGITLDSSPVTVTVGGEVVRRTLVAIDDQTEWRYDRSGTDLGSEWRERTFNDASWPAGKALIADETTTTVEPIRTPITRFNDNGDYVKTFYFRTHFTYTDPISPAVKLRLRHVVDDGAVFYLNGVEVHRFGIAEGPVDATTDATGHENTYEGPFDVPAGLLVAGDNVLSAEVHQAGGSSSDMVFGAELVATIPTIVTNLFAIDGVTAWRYDRSGEDLGSAWRERAYNDAAWPSGMALIADETTTTVEPIRTPISRLNDNGDYVKTFYFRTRFTVPAVGDARVTLRLRHVVDDGAVFYLNGTEVHRFGIAEGPVDATTDATGHENAYEGPFDVPSDLLVTGENVFAVEVHQAGGSSSDMVFGAELAATIRPIGGGDSGGDAPVLSAPVFQGGSVVVSWTGTGVLQSATTVRGPWADIPNATSPHTLTPSGSGQFFRVRQ